MILFSTFARFKLYYLLDLGAINASIQKAFLLAFTFYIVVFSVANNYTTQSRSKILLYVTILFFDH